MKRLYDFSKGKRGAVIRTTGKTARTLAEDGRFDGFAGATPVAELNGLFRGDRARSDSVVTRESRSKA